jgi:hypothetical protein
MQTLQIKVSDSSLIMVLSILKNLKVGVIESISLVDDKYTSEVKFNPKEYFNTANFSKNEIDNFLISSKNEWDII